MKNFIFTIATTVLLLFTVNVAWAQVPGLTPAATEEKASDAPAVPADPLNRETPRGSISGFLNALSKDDFEKAAGYLDLSFYSRSQQKRRGPDLAESLGAVLDKSGWIMPNSMISEQAEGKKNDDLAENLERVGTIRTKDESVDIILERVEGSEGSQIWVVSRSITRDIGKFSEKLTEAPVNRILPQVLKDKKFFGVPAGQWIAISVIIVAAYLIAWIVIRCIVFALRKLCHKLWPTGSCEQQAHFIDAFELPVRLYAAVWIVILASSLSGISVVARHYISTLNVVVAWIAIALFLWRLIDVISGTIERKMLRKSKFGFSSIIFFVRRLAKFIFILLVGIIILDNLGIDVTAGLAALGIGGIALALGAQKTLENFIGSLAIVLDQPVHIGDFCKVGDISGTIEDIGMRSTRIRTNDRTLITIPNGDLSSQKIENYARRDRFLFNKKFNLRYDTPPETVSNIVAKIKTILDSEKKVIPDVMPVRFNDMTKDAIVIETFFYVLTSDFNEFLKIQQNILIQVMQAVTDAEAGFAVPLQGFMPPAAVLENKPAKEVT